MNTETVLIKLVVEYDDTAAGEFDDSACFILESNLKNYKGVLNVETKVLSRDVNEEN